MAAYTTSTRVNALLGSALVTDLLDLDEDDGDDSAVLTQHIGDASAVIDAALTDWYSVPFAAVTDDPDTPDLIQTIATWLVAAAILEPRSELSKQRDIYTKKAWDLLTKLQKGKLSVPGAAKLDGEDAAIGMAYDDVEPTFAGHDDDLVDRMGNW